MYGLLSSVRVVEGASFIAGPYCTLILSQLGAEVIRFEAIGGGPDYRRWPLGPGGDSFYWEGLNKGKKSVALNLGMPEGRELAIAIITAEGKDSGIFVTNYPEAGFLSHESLCSVRPDLVTARILGHADGTSAVDYTVNCAVGFPYMTGPQGGDRIPINHVLPAWDLLAGSTAAVSVLAAIQHRRRTGLGQHIRIPLSDVAAATLGNLGQIAEVAISGADRPKFGNSLFGGFGRDFGCADGKRVMIVALTAKQWKALITALDLEAPIRALESEVGTSLDSDEGARFLHRDRIDAIVEQAVAQYALAALSQRFKSSAVCFGVYRTVHEALTEDPNFVEANPIFATVKHPSGCAYPTPGFPASFSGEARCDPSPAPTLGEDTEEVLTTILRIPGAALGSLHDRGVIRLASHPVSSI
ncbi:CoA transferase [Bradyrhizobium sp. ISRA443]|uniref:CoA transferase n=1 Tax=unclassified Bradyrhizobium TaxID=2631580 RepID=UPI00247A6FFB|nr:MULTISPECIES: CoA transferase [unclassified Bradyrhizobium]WGR93412.1 CoA transferase [Bradyrhizobium sp. ISRA435]WGR97952.1 CoA transferase [Bradyrhizobium sp. ISRA436]WGS04842.1 CoA transferase [Bradyrhizobium sp. ISRA437]WGS11723.1 CoA transferase [Bradyrhizobium sp. ISRA443]